MQIICSMTLYSIIVEIMTSFTTNFFFYWNFDDVSISKLLNLLSKKLLSLTWFSSPIRIPIKKLKLFWGCLYSLRVVRMACLIQSIQNIYAMKPPYLKGEARLLPWYHLESVKSVCCYFSSKLKVMKLSKESILVYLKNSVKTFLIYIKLYTRI